jgi:hypothetical protein
MYCLSAVDRPPRHAPRLNRRRSEDEQKNQQDHRPAPVAAHRVGVTAAIRSEVMRPAGAEVARLDLIVASVDACYPGVTIRGVGRSVLFGDTHGAPFELEVLTIRSFVRAGRARIIHGTVRVGSPGQAPRPRRVGLAPSRADRGRPNERLCPRAARLPIRIVPGRMRVGAGQTTPAASPNTTHAIASRGRRDVCPCLR